MFTQEKSNTGRQRELDVARSLAVLFMILVHIQLYFAKISVISSGAGMFIDFVGSIPAAPMFMFLMGVGINYTRKDNPKEFFKRGIILLAAGYILNFIRGFLPYMINYFIYKDISFYYGALVELLFVDILQFAGLTMIFFGVLKHFKAGNTAIIIATVVLAIGNIVISDIGINNFWLSFFTGLFWGTGEFSYFPFLTWVFYPLAGDLFGYLLIRCQDKRKFYMAAAMGSGILLIAGIFIFNYIIGLPSGVSSDKAYYHHIFTDNIIFTAFVILEIALISFITPYIPQVLSEIIIRWSRNVTPIYFIHWVLIGWTALIIGGDSLSYVPLFMLAVVITVLSDLGAELYRKYRPVKEKN